MNFSRLQLFRTVAIAGVVCICSLALRSATSAKTVPQLHYKVDPSWPKELPHQWVVGAIGGITVDRNNHIWVLQRPSSLTPDEIAADPKSPKSFRGTGGGQAICCLPAPPVLVFDAEGTLLKSWGGPGEGYDWPTTEHGILVDQEGNVWISGSSTGRTGGGPGDRQVLKFTNDGKYLKQIGRPFKGAANSVDTTMLGGPAGLEIDEGAHELYIADGYLNKRVIVFDTVALVFKRMWGAYGNAPNDQDRGPYEYVPNAPHDQQFRSPVHCVRISKDGLVYVCDRENDRIQVFTKDGKFIKEFYLHPETQGFGTACDIVFSRDPGQEYLIVADNTDSVIWILRRSDGTVVGSFGHCGHNAGQFDAVHTLGEDSLGNLYTGEVGSGKRIQKFLLVSGK